jgi:polysaccharide export outer membrane protein
MTTLAILLPVAGGFIQAQSPAPFRSETYVIGPGDILFISVWRQDSLTHQYGVRPDGKLRMPLINDVQAAGLTPQSLRERLTQELSAYLNAPEINVMVVHVNAMQ